MSVKLDKEQIDQFLIALSKELKKEYGRTARFEMIIVGGASIALKHSFRNNTKDIDALISSGTSSIKSVVRKIADQNNLPEDWINTDFSKTSSYSKELVFVSRHFKTYSNVLDVRTVDDEYLIAMKMRSFRAYKNDMSDIIGIINERKEITRENVEEACIKLYGKTSSIKNDAWEYLDDVLKGVHSYEQIKAEEQENKKTLVGFELKYPGELTEDNLEDILLTLKQKELRAEKRVFPPMAERIADAKKEAAMLSYNKNQEHIHEQENRHHATINRTDDRTL